MVRKRMNFEELEKIDSKKMFKTYDMWPDIAKESYEQEFSKPEFKDCLLYTSPSPRDLSTSRMPSSA